MPGSCCISFLWFINGKGLPSSLMTRGVDSTLGRISSACAIFLLGSGATCIFLMWREKLLGRAREKFVILKATSTSQSGQTTRTRVIRCGLIGSRVTMQFVTSLSQFKCWRILEDLRKGSNNAFWRKRRKLTNYCNCSLLDPRGLSRCLDFF